MTVRRGSSDIASREVVSEGQDVVVETHIVEPEIRIDVVDHPLHPPETNFRVAPEVEESIRREDVRISRMHRTLTDTERRCNIISHYYSVNHSIGLQLHLEHCSVL